MTREIPSMSYELWLREQLKQDEEDSQLDSEIQERFDIERGRIRRWTV